VSRDPVRLALEQAAGLEALLALDPELACLAHHLGPLVAELRQRAGLLFDGGPQESFSTFWSAFWAAYPVKVGKIAAEKAARAARKRADWPGDAGVLACLERQRENPRWRAGYIPYPERYFRQGRHLDEVRPSALTAETEPDPEAIPRPEASEVPTPSEVAWGHAQRKIRMQLDSEDYYTWFAPLVPVPGEASALWCPNGRFEIVLTETFGYLLAEVLPGVRLYRGAL